jgi:glycosyltransferase involved in cell wall biosynthesis
MRTPETKMAETSTPSLRITHLWSSDSPRSGGGGATAMVRLHDQLLKHGVSSNILCQRKAGGSANVSELPPLTALEKLLRRFTSFLGLDDMHRLSSFRLPQQRICQESSLLNLHGIHSGFINYLALPALSSAKPTVFTLHDMWMFTGHCAYNDHCQRWKTGCGECPHLTAYPPVKRDTTHLTWLLKRWLYRRSRLTIVAPSRWLADQARQSMLARFPIHHIPNGVDCDVYQPLDAKKCRWALGIPPDKQVIMLSSVNLSDPRKGGDLFLKMLEGLPATCKSQLLILLMGPNGKALERQTRIPCLTLDYLANDRLKAVAYSAADVFVHPARNEIFGLVLLESMACGTPTVAFNVDGIPELVRSGQTGFLAAAEDPDELGQGVVKLLSNRGLNRKLGQQGRQMAQTHFSMDLVAHRYLDLYQSILRQ